jgi:hypothetical protein
VVGRRVAVPLIVNGFLDSEGKPGTLTASAYRPALFTMVAVLAVGFVANLLIRAVPERFHEPSATTAPHDKEEAARPASHFLADCVAILLGYGVIDTVITAAKLFR